MAGKLMYIPNDDTPNYPFYYKKWLKCLDTKLNKPTNQNSITVPKVGKLGNKKPALSPSPPDFLTCNPELSAFHAITGIPRYP